MSVRELVAARQHREDIQKAIQLLPRGTTRVQMSAVCKGTDGDRGCGRRWERCFDLRDPLAPEAFKEIIREARTHEALYEHTGCIDVRIESR